MLTDDRPRSRGGPRRPPTAHGGAGDAPPAAAGPRERRPADGAATAALTVVTLASAAGLFRLFSTDRWAGPVLATAAVTHLAMWLLRRSRVRPAFALPIGLAVVLLMVIWTVFGSYTALGVPGPAVWHHVGRALSNLSNDIATNVAPVPVTPGFDLLAAAGGGVAALAADWAAFTLRNPLAAVLPGLAVFVFASASGRGGGRPLVVTLEVAAVVGFLLVERTAATAGQVWFAGVRDGVAARAMTTGLVAGGLAVALAVAITPVLARTDGSGVLGWQVGAGAGNGERIVPNPLVSLQTRLLQESDVPVFAVSSPIASYWRLTSLDNFNGVTWTSTGSYSSFGTRLPGVPSAGAAIRTVQATFTIQSLDSVWLPEQFNPVSVSGAKHVSFDPASDSLLTSDSTTSGETYSVTSYQFLDDLTASALRAAPTVPADPAETELPAEINGPVTELARSITGGRTTEFDKALAIQSYLRGPGFKYSLHPPTDGSSDQALYNFLFVTRTGYCQQFAGAFAVLARAAGIPTRLAIGFVTGDPVVGGAYQVYDRDAHTWPEVYFGPRYGWVPFEPTPGFAVPGSGSYAGTGGAADGPPPSATPTTVAPPAPSNTVPVQKPSARTGSAVTPTTVAVGQSPRSSTHLSAWLLLAPGLVGAVALWAGLNTGARAVLRRNRRRRALRAGPAAAVADSWEDAVGAMAWWGLRREPAETDDEFAARAADFLERGGVGAGAGPGAGGAGDVVGLAALARRAAFAPSVGPETVGEAAEAAAATTRALWRSTPWPARLIRVVSLPPGSGSRLSTWVRATAGPGAARRPGPRVSG